MNEVMITHIDRVEVMRFYQRKKDKEGLSGRESKELEKVIKLVDDYYKKNIPHAVAQ